MARRLKLLDTHADLCALIERWAQRSIDGPGGYPRVSLNFSSVTSPASSIDPTGCSAQDHRDIDAAMDKIAKADMELFAALKMYYMPWVIISFVHAGYPCAPNQTFYDRLKRAHVWLESELRQCIENRREQAKAYRKQYV